MSKIEIRKCAGCGAPLKSNSSTCSFCKSENIETSPENRIARLDVRMISTGPKLISVIKLIREITKLGLKESKELTENLPSYIVKNSRENIVEDYIKKFELLGASIETLESNSTKIVYSSPENGTSDDIKNKAETKSGPGCFTLAIIIFSVVIIMCAIIILFGLDDILNL